MPSYFLYLFFSAPISLFPGHEKNRFFVLFLAIIALPLMWCLRAESVVYTPSPSCKDPAINQCLSECVSVSGHECEVCLYVRVRAGLDS